MTNVTLSRTDDKDLIATLFQYYLYDMSEYTGWEPNEKGSFAIDVTKIGLLDYWTKPDHHPFLIYHQNELAGFALIRPYPDEPDRYDVGQFFILRKFKRRGIGRAAFNELLDQFPGQWLVRVLLNNVGAKAFWTTAISQRTGEQFTCNNELYKQKSMNFIRFSTR